MKPCVFVASDANSLATKPILESKSTVPILELWILQLPKSTGNRQVSVQTFS